MFSEVWDVMTPNQRRWDLLVDVTLVTIVFAAVIAVFLTY